MPDPGNWLDGEISPQLSDSALYKKLPAPPLRKLSLVLEPVACFESFAMSLP